MVKFYDDNHLIRRLFCAPWNAAQPVSKKIYQQKSHIPKSSVCKLAIGTVLYIFCIIFLVNFNIKIKFSFIFSLLKQYFSFQKTFRSLFCNHPSSVVFLATTVSFRAYGRVPYLRIGLRYD